MNNMIDYRYVPSYYMHCLQTACPMASNCLRQLAAQAMPEDTVSIRIVNPLLTEQTDKCQFYRSAEPQTYARGFVNMKEHMLPRQYNEFMYRLIGKFGRTGYFERRRGERLCSPEEIKTIKTVLHDLELPQLKFDAFEEHVNWCD